MAWPGAHGPGTAGLKYENCVAGQAWTYFLQAGPGSGLIIQFAGWVRAGFEQLLQAWASSHAWVQISGPCKALVCRPIAGFCLIFSCNYHDVNLVLYNYYDLQYFFFRFEKYIISFFAAYPYITTSLCLTRINITIKTGSFLVLSYVYSKQPIFGLTPVGVVYRVVLCCCGVHDKLYISSADRWDILLPLA